MSLKQFRLPSLEDKFAAKEATNEELKKELVKIKGNTKKDTTLKGKVGTQKKSK